MLTTQPWFVFLVTLVVATVQCTKKDAKTCQLRLPLDSPELNGHWRLVSEETFDSKEFKTAVAWNLSTECRHDWIHQESCGQPENIQPDPYGYLVLEAKHRRKNQQGNQVSSYTGASLESIKPIHGYGRVEIRATQPVGRQLRACFYWFHRKSSRFENLRIFICAERGEFLRGILPGQNGTHRWNTSEVFGDFADRMDHFHVYGFEWQPKWFRFFVDRHYSKRVALNETFQIAPAHLHFGIHLGVGLASTGGNIPDNFRKLYWRCPRVLVDSVRYYRLVNESSNLDECGTQTESMVENVQIENVCQRSAIYNADKTSNQNQPKQTNRSFGTSTPVIRPTYVIIAVTIVSILLLSLLAIVYLLRRLRTARAEAKRRQTELEAMHSQEVAFDGLLFEDPNLDHLIEEYYSVPVEYSRQMSAQSKPSTTGYLSVWSQCQSESRLQRYESMAKLDSIVPEQRTGFSRGIQSSLSLPRYTAITRTRSESTVAVNNGGDNNYAGIRKDSVASGQYSCLRRQPHSYANFGTLVVDGDDDPVLDRNYYNWFKR